MIHQLTEEQQEIVDYAMTFGSRNAAEHFSVPYGRVTYLVDKDKRIKGSQQAAGRFVEIRLPDQTATEPATDDSVSFVMGEATIRMSVSDFRKAFGI